MALEAAQLRLDRQMNEAIKASERAYDVDCACANEVVVCWGRPSRADQERIGGRYLARVAEAAARHSVRSTAARTACNQARSQIESIRRTYESVGDRAAVVQFAVAQLQAF